ncbi:hypothetical protein CATRI_08085 [Corynebacterium atrinae]|uniref:hypothetical protein n=1 Tax=Corynebacterium atrinae TaxID=1336740 RepID=UPI0025B479F6|nr:hypothetical protein [Corynebacterium atrinae]WJY63689.1 hypothetical protein CATRI_08085 [Corynebacterium atrinae]
MTQLIFRLQRTLRRRNSEANRSGAIMTVLLYVYAVIGLASILLFSQGEWAGLAGISAIGTVAFLAASLVLAAGDDAVRPSLLASLPLTAKQVVPGFALSALVSSRGILVIICSLATAIFGAIILPGAWAVPWILSMVVAALTTIVLSRILLAVGSGGGRIKQDRANIYGSLIMIVLILGFNMLNSMNPDTIRLDLLGSVLAWTPLAAAPGAVVSAAAGNWIAALAQLCIAIVTLVGGGWLWTRQIASQMVAPLDQSGTGEATAKSKGTILLPGFPEQPWAYVYSRAMRYVRRDSRLLSSLVTMPVVIIFFLYQGLRGDTFFLTLGIAVASLSAAMMAVNDFGFDGPATWTHIITGVDARTLVIARHAASMTPLSSIQLALVVGALFLGEWKIAVLSIGLLFSGAAIALFLSTFNPYPTSLPGTNPWNDKSGYSSAAFLAVFAILLIGWIPSLPGGLILYFVNPVLGAILAIGLPVALWIGSAALSVKRVRTNLPEIFDKVRRTVK